MELTVTVEFKKTVIATHTAPVTKPGDVGDIVHAAIEKARQTTDEPLWDMKITTHLA